MQDHSSASARPPSRSVATIPASIARFRAKREEWGDLEPADRAVLTQETLDRWVHDLAPDDYTLAEVALREKRRRTNIKTFRQGAELTDSEWKLWRFLGRHEGKVVTKLEIARHMWQTADRPIRPWMLRKNAETGNASPIVAHLMNIVSDLRSKLEIDPLRPQHLATVRGVGYVWYDSPPSTDDGVDYADRTMRYSRLREQMMGIVYGPALGPGGEEAPEGDYLEGEVVDAVSYDVTGERFVPHIQTGPEFDRLFGHRHAPREPTTDWRGEGSQDSHPEGVPGSPGVPEAFPEPAPEPEPES